MTTSKYKITAYIGLNGRSITAPEAVISAAEAIVSADPRREVRIDPVEGAGGYTIPPLDGWRIEVRRPGARRRFRYYSPEGEYREEVVSLSADPA